MYSKLPFTDEKSPLCHWTTLIDGIGRKLRSKNWGLNIWNIMWCDLRHLEEAYIPDHLLIDFKTLLKECLKPNICQFIGSVYALPPGVGISIGSPLGSLIGEVFVSDLKSEIFQSGPQSHLHVAQIFQWYNCIWTGPEDALQYFLVFLNGGNTKMSIFQSLHHGMGV